MTLWWTSLGFWTWRGSEYARVTNKISHDKQGSDYVSSYEYAGLIQDSAENGPPPMFDRVLRILQIINIQGLNIKGLSIWQGYRGFIVNCILKVHGILNVLSSKYDKVLNLSGVQICYSYKGLRIKYFTVHIWHGFEYTTLSNNAKVLNMSGFIKKTLPDICLTRFRIFLRCWIWQGSVYARVTQSSVQNATL